jgi:prevent-host-death family protein
MPTTLTSREFNQDTARAKRAAQDGPVVITDRGRPTHVLLAYEDYAHLTMVDRVLDLLGGPDGIADVELRVESSRAPSRPADLG